MQQRKRRGRYLDVSEYMLKEYSPINKAMNPDIRLTEKNYLQRYPTPEIGPIDHDTSTLNITPFLNGLIEIADQHLDQFLLDSDCAVSFQIRSKDRSRGQNRQRRRSNSLVLFTFDNDLQDIMEESEFEFNSMEESYSNRYDQEDDFSDQDLSERQSLKPSEMDKNQLQTQNQYRQKMEKYLKQPKQTLIKQIRKIADFSGQSSEEKKLENIKKTIESYIVDFQMPCFEQAWNELSVPLESKVEIITQGIEDNFKKRIGHLTFENRRIKLLKYLQKKRMRKWRKKVSYDCRKKVADSRLRIKGKFVTREQVCSQLGIVDIDIYSGNEIRELLEKKMEGDKDRSQ